MARTPLFSWMGRMIRAAMAQQTELIQPDPAENALETSQWPNRTISRRDFLKGTLGAAGTVAALSLIDAPSIAGLAKASSVRPLPKSSNQKDSPIAIVGGGLGGLVTAYRLSPQGIRCELYEGSHRLGGRVFTRSNFNAERMFVELGGELVDTGHSDLIALCQELNVPLEPFVQQELGIEPAIFYSQGKVYTEGQVLEAFIPLAVVLAEDLQKCFPNGEIVMPTAQQPAQAAWLDKLSLAEYLHSKRQVVPEWLIRLISNAYIGEYGLETEDQSALNLLMLIGTDTNNGFRIFGESDETMRIRGGNSRLVEALTQAIQPHVPIHYGHRLSRVALRKITASQAQNHFGKANQAQLHLGMTVGGHFRWILASQAVFAIPFSVLRDVAGLDNIGLSPLKQQCIAEWGYGTNSKQMMGFQSRFWRTAHATTPANSGELITDMPSQCYWETSRLQPGKAGIFTNFMGGKAGKEATSSQWKIALQELKPLFGELGELQDGNLAFFNWHNHPWTKGSYTCPRPGQYTTLMGAAQIPELDNRLFFAGEHCSLNSAGYMNGAVESGNTAVLQISEALKQSATQPRLEAMTTV